MTLSLSLLLLFTPARTATVFQYVPFGRRRWRRRSLSARDDVRVLLVAVRRPRSGRNITRRFITCRQRRAFEIRAECREHTRARIFFLWPRYVDESRPSAPLIYSRVNGDAPRATFPRTFPLTPLYPSGVRVKRCRFWWQNQFSGAGKREKHDARYGVTLSTLRTLKIERKTIFGCEFSRAQHGLFEPQK